MRIVGSKRGAGLIDVMLTMFLIGVAGVIMAAAYPTCFRASSQAQEYKLAAAIAQKKMEQLRAMNYESLTYPNLLSATVIDASSTSPYQFTSIDSIPSQLPQGSGELTITDISSDTRRVTVLITWQGRGAARTVELNTLFVDKRTRKI